MTWRFLFAPGTLGAIAWLAAHREEVGAVRAGLVLSGLGDRRRRRTSAAAAATP